MKEAAMTRALALVLILGWASPAPAADTAWLLGIAAANGADLWTTEDAIARGAHEANPLLTQRPARVALKAAGTTAEILAVHALWRGHRGAAIGVAVGLIVANGWLALHNDGVARQKVQPVPLVRR
jgi:hypothetical protein